jgi:hypothetical protein
VNKAEIDKVNEHINKQWMGEIFVSIKSAILFKGVKE